MTRRVKDVAEENFILRKQVKYLEARITLLMGERDAARTALQKGNFQHYVAEMEERYKLKRRKGE